MVLNSAVKAAGAVRRQKIQLVRSPPSGRTEQSAISAGGVRRPSASAAVTTGIGNAPDISGVPAVDAGVAAEAAGTVRRRQLQLARSPMSGRVEQSAVSDAGIRMPSFFALAVDGGKATVSSDWSVPVFLCGFVAVCFKVFAAAAESSRPIIYTTIGSALLRVLRSDKAYWIQEQRLEQHWAMTASALCKDRIETVFALWLRHACSESVDPTASFENVQKECVSAATQFILTVRYRRRLTPLSHSSFAVLVQVFWWHQLWYRLSRPRRFSGIARLRARNLSSWQSSRLR